MKSNLGEALSKLRRETGRSQQNVASDLGVSQALLSHYETGAREPKLEFISKVCDYYGVTSDYLLGRSKNRNQNNPAAIKETIDALERLKVTEHELLAKLKKLSTEN